RGPADARNSRGHQRRRAQIWRKRACQVRPKRRVVNDMKIVVLDGYTANPGDLSWEEFEKLGECQIYDRTPEAQVVERAREAEILLTNKTPMSRAAIDALPKLRYI